MWINWMAGKKRSMTRALDDGGQPVGGRGVTIQSRLPGLAGWQRPAARRRFDVASISELKTTVRANRARTERFSYIHSPIKQPETFHG